MQNQQQRAIFICKALAITLELRNKRYQQIKWKNTLEVMLDIDMLIKLAPASVASIVLPVPGGPKSNIPLQGCRKQLT
jgi:hypothetical protein